MSKQVCIVLVGGPCSGKSSAGKLAIEKLQYAEYISSGDIAREMAKENRTIMDDLNSGKLAPENRMRNAIHAKLTMYLLLDELDVVILDGFPRFGAQAEWLRTTLPHTIDIRYVLFDTSFSKIIERSIHRNRSDDKSLEQRLDYYYNTTYKELRKYIDVVINTDELSPSECSELLARYIKEAIR